MVGRHVALDTGAAMPTMMAATAILAPTCDMTCDSPECYTAADASAPRRATSRSSQNALTDDVPRLANTMAAWALQARATRRVVTPGLSAMMLTKQLPQARGMIALVQNARRRPRARLQLLKS